MLGGRSGVDMHYLVSEFIALVPWVLFVLFVVSWFNRLLSMKKRYNELLHLSHTKIFARIWIKCSHEIWSHSLKHFMTSGSLKHSYVYACNKIFRSNIWTLHSTCFAPFHSCNTAFRIQTYSPTSYKSCGRLHSLDWGTGACTQKRVISTVCDARRIELRQEQQSALHNCSKSNWNPLKLTSGKACWMPSGVLHKFSLIPRRYNTPSKPTVLIPNWTRPHISTYHTHGNNEESNQTCA